MGSVRHAARRVLLPLAAVALLLPAVSGCAGREYDLPRDICGVKVSKGVLDPLLPDGEKLEQKRERREHIDRHFVRCDVTVDGGDGLYITLYEMPSVDRKGSTEDHPRYIKNPPFSGWAEVRDGKSLGSTACREGSKNRSDALTFTFSLHTVQGDGEEERRAATERFVKAWLPGEKKKEGCTR
ncbi:hypothetical protein OIE63_33675 [Streptomyces sp. NBC_01795]|uniref:hypothetical protein n=1 Tax=Streptomyces sp. NBC_01795 TaxID=2975943 RepID=UPI002DD8BFCB|nr:hypothetical protein [Streptomyces sp. NBC_01795]WSA95957.1 hypothetical protein OIE63_33675 [Streptomyces sp. NBC_01795]